MEPHARRLIARLWAQWDDRKFWSALRAVHYSRCIRVELRAEPSDPEIVYLFKELTR